MEVTEPLQFTHKDRKDIYEYIERHGSVREADVRRALNLDRWAMGAHLTLLKRDGYIRERDDRLEVAYQDAEAETQEFDGVTFTIRQAEQGDLDGLIEVIRTVAEDGTYLEAESVAHMIDHEQVVLRHNELQSRMFFVATVDDDIVGWVHLDMPEAEKLGHTAVLTLGVESAYRGHGIGGTLLERGQEWARAHDFEKLYNSVPATNERGIEFLEDHGWTTEAVRSNHYKINGDYVDEVMTAVRL
jgi:N-acetylglutamate synthase-like GNAT family acetyltransferase